MIQRSLLLLVSMLFVGCGAEPKTVATLSLGMAETDAVAQLKLVGATDGLAMAFKRQFLDTGDDVAETPRSVSL